MLDAMPLDGIALNPGISHISIQENSVRFEGPRGEGTEIPADTVIMTSTSKAKSSLFDRLRTSGVEVHVVGDCRSTGYILGATRDAADTAAKI
jgi:hypothetical protein